jgi:hypothetical protein
MDTDTYITLGLSLFWIWIFYKILTAKTSDDYDDTYGGGGAGSVQ